jgi:hypothetical protein
VNEDPIDLDTPFGDQPVNLDEDGFVTAQSFQAMSLKMVNAGQEAWNQVAAQLFGTDTGEDSPLAIVMRVRAALVAGRLDSVRALLSDHLYNRWRHGPPKPPTAFSDNIAITMSASSDEEGVMMVTVGAGMTITGASEETWRFVRNSVPVAPSDITTVVEQPGNCPNCGAPFEGGATVCRYCGAALAVPAATQPDPSAQRGSETDSAIGWVVDDVAPTNSMAA